MLREAAVEKERLEFLKSYEGVNTALREVEALADELERYVQEIEANLGLKLKIYKSPYKIAICSYQGSVTFRWEPTCNNMVDDAVLIVEVWDGFRFL